MKQKRLPFNIIDVLVIALLIGIVVIVVSKVRAAKTQQPADTTVAAISGPQADFAPNLRFVCVAEGVERDLAERIVSETANRIYNSSRLYDAYVTEAVIEPCRIVGTADGQLLTHPYKVNLRFTVEAQLGARDSNTDVSGNFNPFLGSQEIRLGKAYTLKTMRYELTTKVVELEADRDG